MTLEPCPFCGGEAEWRDDPGVCDVPFGLVVAHKDHCFLNHIAFEEADIISAWNTRAPDPRIAALTAEVARKDEALRFAHSWLGYWATHIGNCRGGQVCTCGLTRVRYDARAALEARND